MRSRWEAAARLVAGHRDVLDGRTDSAEGRTPPAVVARGWAAFLLSLDEATLDAIEVLGPEAPWPGETPPGLRELARTARDVCDLASLRTAEGPVDTRLRRGESPRKHAQVDGLGRVLAPLAARADRVVDVGSGHGHLTRAIADQIDRPVVGLERSAPRAERARGLSSGSSATFAVTDVLRDGLLLARGDCVVGLHACGELGDAMVRAVAHSTALGLALVGCCLQKRRQSVREPLCAGGAPPGALALPRALLGLSNLVATDRGVEASRADNLAGRERRLALRRLLREAGILVAAGAELEGLNRRAAHGELGALVERAFALRGQPAPSPHAVGEAAGWARREHALARRLSVPRSLLSRVLEVYVLLDRALYLEQAGMTVEVGTLFPSSISPRNLALLASRATA